MSDTSTYGYEKTKQKSINVIFAGESKTFKKDKQAEKWVIKQNNKRFDDYKLNHEVEGRVHIIDPKDGRQISLSYYLDNILEDLWNLRHGTDQT